jgi:hypothetical protein
MDRSFIAACNPWRWHMNIRPVLQIENLISESPDAEADPPATKIQVETGDDWPLAQ